MDQMKDSPQSNDLAHTVPLVSLRTKFPKFLDFPVMHTRGLKGHITIPVSQPPRLYTRAFHYTSEHRVGQRKQDSP